MTQAAQPAQLPTTLVAKFASRFSIEPNKLLATLKDTAFRQGAGGAEITNEQMAALLIVADSYSLNPFTKEIFAFPDKARGIVPIVSVDGWARIVNEHKEFDGCEFEYGPSDGAKHKGAPAWIECRMFRRDRSHPTVIREYLAECYRDTPPWNSHPSRMLRWKAYIQCARVAFGFAGIYDDDEGARVIEGTASVTPAGGSVAEINRQVRRAEPAPAEAETAPAAVGRPARVKTGPARAAEIDAALPGFEPPENLGTPVASSEPAPPTFAEIIDRMQRGASVSADALDMAADNIRYVTDEAQRAELDVEYRRLRKSLAA